MDEKKILETFDKEKLTAMMMEYSEEGYIPYYVLLLRSDYHFSAMELENLWDIIYEEANALENKHIDMGARIIDEAARAVFTHAQDIEDKETRERLLKMLVENLYKACEEDGIGMYYDSEWYYEEICHQIEDYLGIVSP